MPLSQDFTGPKSKSKSSMHPLHQQRAQNLTLTNTVPILREQASWKYSSCSTNSRTSNKLLRWSAWQFHMYNKHSSCFHMLLCFSLFFCSSYFIFSSRAIENIPFSFFFFQIINEFQQITVQPLSDDVV